MLEISLPCRELVPWWTFTSMLFANCLGLGNQTVKKWCGTRPSFNYLYRGSEFSSGNFMTLNLVIRHLSLFLMGGARSAMSMGALSHLPPPPPPRSCWAPFWCTEVVMDASHSLKECLLNESVNCFRLLAQKRTVPKRSLSDKPSQIWTLPKRSLANSRFHNSALVKPCRWLIQQVHLHFFLREMLWCGFDNFGLAACSGQHRLE